MPATLPEQEEETLTIASGGVPGPFAAWRHRDYRLLVSGQGIATLGRQMQSVAITYQVYQLHHSTLELGARKSISRLQERRGFIGRSSKSVHGSALVCLNTVHHSILMGPSHF